MSHDPTANATGARLSRGRLLFVAALFVAGFGLVGWAAVRALTPPPEPPDFAQDARDYLARRQVAPLSEPLVQLLAEAEQTLVASQAHPLIDLPAPDVILKDHERKVWKLSEQKGKRPIVLVFYYGYSCNHCVAQLFALNADIERFRELGAEVVAVSPDPCELTVKRFAKYGTFAFPTLSDPGNRVAKAYGVVRPAEGEREEDLLHGTFLIDRLGIVRWARTGEEPFTNDRTLLYEVARLEDRLPKPAGD